MSFFKPADARLYTVMADTAAAQELWSRVANQVFENDNLDDGYEMAIEIANLAVRDFRLADDAALFDECARRSISSHRLEPYEPARVCHNPPNIGPRR
jgi:hypothetical protein